MIAMLATLEVVSDPHWFLDSGATNHYTPTIDNLTNKSTYDGHDQVHMSNGEKALPCFIKFKTMVELQLGTSIKRLETNGGGEFKAFHTFLQSCGILHHASCLHIHEQNGLSKRKHHHIIECVSMELEFQAFCSNNTWSLVPPPLNNQVVGCKWVFQFKHNSDGSVNKYKTRLVAKGFHQVRVLIFMIPIVPSSNLLPFGQLDFNNACLNDILKENKLSHPRVLLSQQKYITEILHKACMDETNPTPTPMVKGISLSLSAYVGAPFDDPHLYHCIIRNLQYATITHPKITFAFNRVSQFMQHLIDHGILFNSYSSLKLVAFFDAYWVSNLDDHKSTSGYCLFLRTNLITWSAKK
ncbi:hypothetical protein AAG906_003271 [Vitis piasezkii]